MRPDARRERLVVEAVGDELVIYDLQRHRVHQLNRTAALLWQRCDGQKTVTELKRILQEELNPAVNEVLVWQALKRLGKAHLLRHASSSASGGVRTTRRQMLRGLGKTAALALLAPAITTMLAPTPVRDDNPCNSAHCKKACKDQCTSDKDCRSSTTNKLVCKLLSCEAIHCASCSQRRCVKSSSPST